MNTIGFDVVSSSIKAALFDTIECIVVPQSTYHYSEMSITAVNPGSAEQDPEMWPDAAKNTTKDIMRSKVNPSEFKAIRISYQMHGLVVADKNQKALRPSIIWCDSRVLAIGDNASDAIGHEECLQHMLNSPGNFTASKLGWVTENEPGLFAKTDKFMLPRDSTDMKLTRRACTTMSGLSEGILWDFASHSVSETVLSQYGIERKLVSDIVPTFGDQGNLTADAVAKLGLKAGTRVTYGAGDAPNNVTSLNVLEPGQVASTASISGVVYGISETIKYDLETRGNLSKEKNRFGILLSINGPGISYSWIKRIGGGFGFVSRIERARRKSPGRLEGYSLHQFRKRHRAYARKQGSRRIARTFESQHPRKTGDGALDARRRRLFVQVRRRYHGEARDGRHGVKCRTCEHVSQSCVHEDGGEARRRQDHMYDTDGSVGAARVAAVGAGIYESFKEAFTNLKKIATVEPDKNNREEYLPDYTEWSNLLNSKLKAEHQGQWQLS